MKEVHTINHIPICDKTARDTIANHDHDEKYSNKNHVHDDRYADINHTHKDYATKETVQNIVNNSIADIPTPDIDLSGYALKTDIPTRVSQLQNNVYYVTTSELNNKKYVTQDSLKDYATKDDLKDCVKQSDFNYEDYQTKVDKDLLTNSDTIVGAINELFQNANNGKEIIADAIGGELRSSDTFAAMGTKIDDITLELREYITDNGVSVGDAEDLYDMVEILQNSNFNSGSTNNVVDLNNCKISCGDGHIFLLLNDGTVWATGRNNYGQLGLGDYIDRPAFTQVTTNISDVKEIVCGDNHTYMIKNNGTVWACGNNGYGELGLGNETTQTTFTQVTTNVSDVKEIACGYHYTVMIKNDGTLWCCGSVINSGSATACVTFGTTFTQKNTDVKSMAVGNYHFFIIKNDDTVWSIGTNRYGQLALNLDGAGSYTTVTTFKQVTVNISDVKEIVCADAHTFMIKNDGTVWVCGYNGSGRLGLGTVDGTANHKTFQQVTTNASDVKEISCGSSHTFMLKNDGTLWTCGANSYGQLGLGTSGDSAYQTTFTQVTTNVSDVKEIVCGANYTYMIKNDSTVWDCGANSYGQLGLGDGTNRTIFTQVKYLFGYITKEEGKEYIVESIGGTLEEDDTLVTMASKIDDMSSVLSTFITNNGGTVTGEEDLNELLEILYTVTSIKFPIIFPGNLDAYIPHISFTKNYVFILKDDGTLMRSELELGYYSFSQVATNVKKVSSNQEGSSVFILKNDGTLWAFGDNNYGQLGLGDTTNRTSFTQVTTNVNGVIDVFCGEADTFIIKNDATIWTCGESGYGLQNSTGNINTFTETTGLPVNDARELKKIITTEYGTCFVLKNDGTLWAYGNDGNGQAGSGLGFGETLTEFTQVLTDVKDIDSAHIHSAALKNDGTVWVTGSNQYGRIGLGGSVSSVYEFTQVSDVSDVVQIGVGDQHTVILKSDETLWGAGSYYYLALEQPSSNSWYTKFTQITGNVSSPREMVTRYEGFMYIREDGTVWTTKDDYESGMESVGISIK